MLHISAITSSTNWYSNWFRVFDREAENLSDHIPITISFKKSLLQHNNKSGSSLGYSRKHVSWHKFNGQQIHNLYTLPLEESLKHFDCELEPDKCFENLSEIIWDISETNLHVTSSNSKNTSHSKRHFQLTEDIQAIKNDLNTLHGQWKATGFNKQSHGFIDFTLKRNEYRSGLRQFILCKENNKIKSLCEASEVNEKLFWKMLKSNKAKCKATCFLVNSEYINSEPDVLDMWANHFESLGQPTIEASFDEPFRLKVESVVQEIFIDCLNTLPCTNSIFIFNIVKEVCQGLECGVAGGPDMTSCEHLKYGRPTLWNILSKLYFKLFFAHDIPSQFRRQLVLPMFKGKGGKVYLKDNYRGTAMFSVFCKVFEMILLRHLEKNCWGKRLLFSFAVWI